MKDPLMVNGLLFKTGHNALKFVVLEPNHFKECAFLLKKVENLVLENLFSPENAIKKLVPIP